MILGDWLSMKCGQKAQMAQADGLTPTDRKDGLVCIMADFHAQMALLRLIFKVLYNDKSSSDCGTLYACKNVINANNITSEAGKDYYAGSELVDNVTKAYVITGKHENLKDKLDMDLSSLFSSTPPPPLIEREIKRQQIVRVQLV